MNNCKHKRTPKARKTARYWSINGMKHAGYWVKDYMHLNKKNKSIPTFTAAAHMHGMELLW